MYFGPRDGNSKILELFGGFEPGCGVVLFNIVISFLYVESILFYPLLLDTFINYLYLYSLTIMNGVLVI